MDNVTIMLTAILYSLQQIPDQLPARPPPVAAKSAKKPQAPPAAKKVEYDCTGHGQIDAQGKPKDCLHKK